MQPDLSSRFAEGPTTATTVDPGERLRTVRHSDGSLPVSRVTPPRVDARA